MRFRAASHFWRFCCFLPGLGLGTPAPFRCHTVAPDPVHVCDGVVRAVIGRGYLPSHLAGQRARHETTPALVAKSAFRRTTSTAFSDKCRHRQKYRRTILQSSSARSAYVTPLPDTGAGMPLGENPAPLFQNAAVSPQWRRHRPRFPLAMNSGAIQHCPPSACGSPPEPGAEGHKPGAPSC
jgi:hypothetical protein